MLYYHVACHAVLLSESLCWIRSSVLLAFSGPTDCATGISRSGKRACFSDESIFRCFSNSNTVKVRRRSTEGYLPECLSSTVKHGPQIHVWGIIGPYGSGPLKVVHGNLNSINYQQNIINDIDQVCNAMVFPLERAIFMQDKAPAHWSASTRVFLANRNLPLLETLPIAIQLKMCGTSLAVD